MKIDEAIQQTKKFSTEWQKAVINLVYTSSWVSAILEKRAEHKQITLSQFNVLRILRGQYPNPITNNLIKSRMLTNMPDISRLIDRLVLKGLVDRCKSNIDKRAVSLLITEAGLQVLQELEEEMLLNDILPKNISEANCKRLNELLDTFRGCLESESENN
ncbi:MarR family transcriptional regulator [Sphingobacterium sp. SRCM116780]|uniref:MarR family winged helix-turn-helix transcriptional regulator n=1 Tax=Sphingobacterium sp. SRCM116780 TaxID=2907623 RepID=UPI001F4575F7|nr:MarR family transcriptional regulator [Sphingobacterium sp. SRCM116780]UIR54528.1 MarR family transcriptional regulator [Sphingobacterium sp. SRCM116780]